MDRKPAISLKRSKIEPRLPLMTNIKSHTRYRLVPKSMTLDDTEGPLRTLSKPRVFGAHHENLNEDRPILHRVREKKSLWFTMHNCNKFEYIFTVFGTNHSDSSFY